MKKAIGILILVMLIGGFGAYKMYNKPHKDVVNSDAAYTLKADSLFAYFSADEPSARELYVDELIQLEGRIAFVDASNESSPQLVLQTFEDQGYVRCGFAQDDLSEWKEWEEGQEVKIKGICIGFNSPEGLDLLSEEEVVMSRCTLIE